MSSDKTTSARGSSLWLRPSTIIVFAFVFATCAAFLLGLRRWIDSRGGLSLTGLENQHYAWTYGPMAFLLVLLSFWRRIEYHCKISQPWWEMLKGPASAPVSVPAARSVLLDYVSPTQIKSLLRSIRLWHFPVVASITTFLLLKLVVVLSATLFVLIPTSQTFSTKVAYTTEFNDTEKGTIYSDATLWAFLANMEAHKDGTTRWGAPGHLAYQNFAVEIPSELNTTSVTAEVQTFQPRISCEIASTTVAWNKTSMNSADLIYVSVSSNTCFSNSVRLPEEQICYHITSTEKLCPHMSLNGRLYNLFRVQCDGEKEPQQRYVIAVIDFGTDLENFEAPVVTSTVCRVGYEVVRADVTHHLATSEVTVSYDDSQDGVRLANTTDHDFAEILMGNLGASSGLVVTDERLPFGGDKSSSSGPGSVMFHILMSWLQFPDNLDTFLDATRLTQATEAVLHGLAVEAARANLTSSLADAAQIEAIILSTDNRLFFRPLTLWTTISGFFVMSGICFALALVLMRQSLLPRGIASIALQAAILSGSSTVLTELKGSGHLKESELYHALDRSHFTAEVSSGQVLMKRWDGEPNTVARTRRWKLPRPRPRLGWSPLPMTIYGGVLTFSLPLAAVISLEVLQRLSDQRHGLFSMGDGSSTIVPFFIRTTTVLVIMIISTLYNNLEFVVAVMAPFVSLRQGSASSKRSILFAPLDTLPFIMPFSHLSRRSFGAASISLTALLGGLLTIAASGLWVTTVEPAKIPEISVGTVENWDYSWFQDWTDDNGAAARLNVIRHGGGGVPEPLIVQQVVLPRISIPDDGRIGFDDLFTYSVQALRPTLHCTDIAKANIRAMVLTGSQSAGRMGQWAAVHAGSISIDVPVPPRCAGSQGTAQGDDTETPMVNLQPDYTGLTQAVWGLARFDVLEQVAAEASALGIDCPSAVFHWGLSTEDFDFTKSEDPDPEGWTQVGRRTLNATAIVCSQGMESVPVTVQLKRDSALDYLVPAGPAILHHDAAEPVKNGSVTALHYKIQDHLNRGYGAFPNDGVPVEYDRFFNHLFWGSGGVPQESITGPANAEKFQEVVIRDYEQYMRLIIDRSFRPTNLSTEATSMSTEVSGTRVRHVARLALHRPSKIALQVILSAMTILGLVGRIKIRQQGILPRNPCSIASVAAMLADSQLCDPDAGIMPKNAQRMSEEELQQSLDGWVFSLGWWDVRGGMVSEQESEVTARQIVEDLSITDLGSRIDTPLKDGEEGPRKRVFGIDAGQAGVYDFRKGGSR